MIGTIIGSLLVGILAFLVVFLILFVLCDIDTPLTYIIGIVVGVVVAVMTFIGIVTEDKKTKASFDNGQTITTIVKRVDWNRGTVYILTDDSETFSVYEKEYMLLTPGDTLTYRLYEDGVRNKILSVKYSNEEYHQKGENTVEEEDEHGVVYFYYPNQTNPTPVFF